MGKMRKGNIESDNVILTNKIMKKDVLGVKIDDVTMDQALEIVQGWLQKGGKHYIVTPNPEIVMMAQKDTELKNIINKADLSLPDGVGLKSTTDIVCHTSGIDLMEELIKLAADWGFTVGFLGGKDGVAIKASECLKKKYPKLTVRYAFEGPVIPAKAGIYTNKDLWIPDQVRDDKVDLLFVAFGPPKQEKWIAKNLDKIPIKIAMGVGGSFDYLSGRVPRAPKWIRNLGFEWLFRLIREPWRIKRQLALVKFLIATW